MSPAFRSASPSRHALVLLALLAALPPALRADDCISDPAEGIFCSGDENPDFETITVSGHQTATWTPATLVQGRTYYYTLQTGSSLSVTGAADDYYQAKVIASGPGDIRLVAGHLRVHSFGGVTGDIHVSDSRLAASLFPDGGNWHHDSVFHLTNATLRLERSPNWGDYSNVSNPFVISGDARLEIVAPGFFNPAALTVAAANVISGDGTFIKTGPGLLRLEASNTYTGGTRIDQGDLEIFDDANLGAADAALTFAPDTGLWLNDGFATSRATTFEGGLAYIGVRSGSATWNGVLSGEGALVKTGPGTLTLTAANTYAGGTTIAGGALSIAADAHLGAADTSLTLGDGATLTATAGFASSARPLALSGASGRINVPGSAHTLTWNGATSGAGKLVKQGAGRLVLAGGTGHSGGAQIDAGTLEVSVSSSLGGTGATTWTGPITGPGAFVKSGAGTLVLNGAATHAGYTTVRGGTLRVGAADALSADSALFLIGGSTLDLAGHDQTVGDLDSYNLSTGLVEASTVDLAGATLTNLNRVTNLWAGDITGEGTLVKKGAAEMKWYAANSFTGTLRVDTGTVSAQAAHVFSPGAVVQLAPATTLRLNSHAQTVAGLSGSGSVALGSAALAVDQSADTAFSGLISGTGSVRKSGSGVLALSGVNTFSGGLTLAGGAISVAADSALGDASGGLTFDGGTLETAAPLESARAIALVGAGTVRTAADTTLSGEITGEGSFVKTGSATLTLSGNNTYSGGTTVQAGALRAAHVNAFGSGGVEISGGTVDFDGLAISNPITNRGGTLTGLANYAGAQTIAADVSFSGAVGGSVVVTDTAALDSTGATFTGPVTVQNGGALSGTGTLGTVTIAAGGLLSPGNSPGLLTLGDGSILSGTTLIELGGPDRGSGYDAIDVRFAGGELGSVTVGGTLDVVFWGGWSPEGEASFHILQASSFGGTFAQINLPALGSGYEWSTARLLTDGLLDIVASAVPEPASAAALAGAALLGFAATRRRRRERR